MKYLDSSGLSHLWARLKSFFIAKNQVVNNAATTDAGYVLDARVGKSLSDSINTKADKTTATASSNGLMSASDKSKLDGIGAGSNVKSVNGKTGAVTLSKADVGLGNVDNTSDVDKHILANNIQWGGPNIVEDISPIDAAMSDLHSANRLAFCSPKGITIEYSNDAGATWVDYGATDNEKVALTSGIGQIFWLGKVSSGIPSTDDELRITIDAYDCGIYCQLKTILIEFGTSGNNGCTCKIEKSYNKDINSFYDVGEYFVSGWSGWNSIPVNLRFGTAVQLNNVRKIRLTFLFKSVGNRESGAPNVSQIKFYSGTAWTTHSSMGRYGHLYEYDSSQNAFFPAQVTATKFNGTATSADSATKATQDASGNVITSTYATKGELNSHVASNNNPHKVTKAQIGLANVANYDQSKAIKSITRNGTTFTATALDGTTTTFTQQDTNTTYPNATTSAPGLMSSTDKSKLDSIASGADVSTISTVKVNGTALTPDSNKAVNIAVPTLANNATTTVSGMALDARMGKTLSDQISSLNLDAATEADIDGCITKFAPVEITYNYQIYVQDSCLYLPKLTTET